MIIYIYGEDSFRSRQYLKQTIDQFKKTRDPQGYNVVVLDAQNSKASKVMSEIMAAPFLAERRLVVLENVLSSSDKDLLAGLIDKTKTKGLPDSNVIVFWQSEKLGKVKEVRELEKLLKAEQYAQEFPQLSGRQLQTWINQEITKRGGVISQHALTYLADNVGQDMWWLSSLINQLLAYTDKNEIQLADVQLFLEEKIDDNIFNMVAAIVGGQTKQAFRLLEKQRQLGEDEAHLFGLIVWQFRVLLEMRDLFEREDDLPSPVMAKKLGLHPFVVKKNLALVKRYPLARLKELHQQLLEIDYKTKTGQGDQSLLIDLFAARVT